MLDDITSPLLGEGTGSFTPTVDESAPDPSEAIELEVEPMPNQNRNSIRINNSLTESAVSTSSYFTHFSKLYHDEVEKEEEEEDDDGGNKRGCCTRFCILMDKWPVTFIIIAALIGIGIGLGLSVWSPDDHTTKDVVVLWVGLVGDLFIRALRCIVLPLVFVSIAVSVMDML